MPPPIVNHSEKKSPMRRFFLVLGIALPLAILVAGVFIIKTPRFPNLETLQKNIVGSLFILYSLYRFFQAYRKYKTDAID